MTEPPIRAQLAQEIAAAQLEHAALQLAAVVAQVRAGDSTQAQLRAARARLEAAAVAYAEAHGYQPAPPRPT